MQNSTYLNLLHRSEYSALLKLSIMRGNLEELKNSLKYNEVLKVLSKESGYFLEQSYTTNNLHIAKFLLSYGIEFSIKNFAYLSKDVFLEHLYDIRQYLSIEQFDLLFNFIVTINSRPLLATTQDKCYVVEDILTNLTFTNDRNKVYLIKQMYSTLYKKSTTIIHNLLKAVALSNFKHQSLKIFMPFDKPYAYLNSIQTSDNKIYIPVNNLDKEEQGFLVHELIHYLTEVLIQNDGKPFRDEDKNAQKLYHSAAKESIAEILVLFNKDKDNIITKEMIKDEMVTLRNICSKVAHAIEFHIFSFNSRQNSKEHKDKLVEAYFKHSGTSDEHNSHFLKHYLNNIIDNYQLNDQAVYLISRMADLCLRSDKELEYEPVAFAAELEIHAPNNITRSLNKLLHNDFAKIIKIIQEKDGIYECNNSIPVTLDANIDYTGEISVLQNNTVDSIV